jgi:hypothetical protein
MAVLSPSHSATRRKAHAAPGVLPYLLLLWAVLICANLLQDISMVGGDSRIWLLDVDVERSLYTWYSQLLLAGVAVLLLDTGAKMFRVDRLMGVQWLGLSAIFGLLSADEALSLHELASQKLHGVLDTSGVLAFAWVIPAAAICAVGMVAAIPFLRRLPTRVRGLMLLSAALFLGGAIGMEMVGGKILSDNGENVSALAYRLSVALEEGLEGLGVLVFLYSHLIYRRDQTVRPMLQSI